MFTVGAVKLNHLGADSRGSQQLPTGDSENLDDLRRAVVRILDGNFAHRSGDGVFPLLRPPTVQGLHGLTEHVPDFVREVVLGERLQMLAVSVDQTLLDRCRSHEFQRREAQTFPSACQSGPMSKKKFLM